MERNKFDLSIFHYFRTETILRIRRFGESGHDLLLKQFTAGAVHDPRIPKRFIQLGIRWT